MPDDSFVYWDANVFLSYINGDADRLPDMEALIEDSAKGKIQLVTSTVSIAEVAFGATEQTGHALDSAVAAKIDRLWVPPFPLKLVEFHARIGAAGASLVRLSVSRGWHLKPIDAIHLASAQQMAVKEFHTYDEPLDKYASDLGFNIIRPAAHQRSLFPS